jgi:[ribosomal protein S18]-alanine N-acetyltransferase
MDVRYVINPMTMNDISRVIEIEKLAYPTSQWPPSAYTRELQENQWAHYIVVRDTKIEQALSVASLSDAAPRRAFQFPRFSSKSTASHATLESIVGYAGLWLMIDEAHVTTIATHPDVRRRGLGELLLANLIDIAYNIGARWVTLEVRVTNFPAQALYQKYGFSIVSTRPHYYSDNNEDAYIMWTEEITTFEYRKMFASLKSALYERLAGDEGQR